MLPLRLEQFCNEISARFFRKLLLASCFTSPLPISFQRNTTLEYLKKLLVNQTT